MTGFTLTAGAADSVLSAQPLYFPTPPTPPAPARIHHFACDIISLDMSAEIGATLTEMRQHTVSIAL
jgi:hypothetical protein